MASYTGYLIELVLPNIQWVGKDVYDVLISATTNMYTNGDSSWAGKKLIQIFNDVTPFAPVINSAMGDFDSAIYEAIDGTADPVVYDSSYPLYSQLESASSTYSFRFTPNFTGTTAVVSVKIPLYMYFSWDPDNATQTPCEVDINCEISTIGTTKIPITDFPLLPSLEAESAMEVFMRKHRIDRMTRDFEQLRAFAIDA